MLSPTPACMWVPSPHPCPGIWANAGPQSAGAEPRPRVCRCRERPQRVRISDTRPAQLLLQGPDAESQWTHSKHSVTWFHAHSGGFSEPTLLPLTHLQRGYSFKDGKQTTWFINIKLYNALYFFSFLKGAAIVGQESPTRAPRSCEGTIRIY